MFFEEVVVFLQDVVVVDVCFAVGARHCECIPSIGEDVPVCCGRGKDAKVLLGVEREPDGREQGLEGVFRDFYAV